MAIAGPFYFAWVDKGTAFNAAVHNVCNEYIFSIELSQIENEYAILAMEIENPGVGLLSPGRKQWAWLAWFNGTIIVPLFYGRLDTFPDDIHSETINIELIAEPVDADEQKQIIATALRAPPYYDAAWMQEDIDNVDAVLETYTKVWHSDRITHVVSVSDIINAEDGTIEIQESEHFYDALSISKGEKQPNIITIKATAKWRQKANGEVDITDNIWKKFIETGSMFSYPAVASLTSSGLLDDWPEPLKNLGGGWSVSANSVAISAADYIQSGFYPIIYLDRAAIITTEDDAAEETTTHATTQWQNPLILSTEFSKQTEWETWDLSIPIVPIHQKTILAYEADRERSEILTISLTADVQQLYYDDDSETEEIIELNSEFIDQPVDANGTFPIGDLRRNMYFPTDRGNLTIQYFMLLMRAIHVFRSRAVTVEFATEFDKLATVISGRKSVLLHDQRLPGAQAIGKVISYRLLATASEQMAIVSIGSAIGQGVVLPAASNDGDTYAEDYADDWTELIAVEIDILTGEMQYNGLDGTIVIDDDGVDFFNMSPTSVLLSLTITNGLEDQKTLVDEAVSEGITDPDPLGILRDNPTRPRFQLVPVDGGAFQTEYEVTTQNLVIPKMIDLGAV
jgi:hypothetical protein